MTGQLASLLKAKSTSTAFPLAVIPITFFGSHWQVSILNMHLKFCTIVKVLSTNVALTISPEAHEPGLFRKEVSLPGCYHHQVMFREKNWEPVSELLYPLGHDACAKWVAHFGGTC